MSDEATSNYVTTSYEYPARVSFFKAIVGKDIKNDKGEITGKEWSTMLLIPKTDTVTINKIKAIITRVATEKWGANIPKGVKNTFRDGDKDGKGGVPDDVEAGSAPYGGHHFINVKSDRRPKIYNANADCISHDKDGNHLPVPADMIVSGDYSIAYINCYAWGPGKFGSGVSWGLKSVQQFKKGKPLGDTDSSTPGFKPVGAPAAEKPADLEGADQDPLGLMG